MGFNLVRTQARSQRTPSREEKWSSACVDRVGLILLIRVACSPYCRASLISFVAGTSQKLFVLEFCSIEIQAIQNRLVQPNAGYAGVSFQRFQQDKKILSSIDPRFCQIQSVQCWEYSLSRAIARACESRRYRAVTSGRHPFEHNKSHVAEFFTAI
eukprot:scaffold2557_cov121-Cylindrotheca_fusiformis.AAC.3